MGSRTDQARELALELIRDRPGVQQREVIAAIQGQTRLASSTVSRMLQGLERDGVLEGGRDGRRKTYTVAAGAPAAEPSPKLDTSPGTRSELVAVVTALFIAASLVAFFLAPDKDDQPGVGSASPVAAPAEQPPVDEPPAQEPRSKPKPKPKPKAKPKPRRERGASALAAAKRTQVAVLSGSGVPGIAGKTGDQLKRKGFRVGTVANAPGPSDRSVVLYARGKKSAARALARSLKIKAVKAANPAARAMAPGAGLLVVVGADRR